MSAAELMSDKPQAAQQPLTESQLKEFRIASNRVSLESLRYAADICGHTPLLTETITALQKIVGGDPVSRPSDSVHCRQLYKKVAKSNFRDEPLLDAILISLKWASSEGKGQFIVGNIVDPVYAARARRKEKHSDAEVYEKLEEIRRQCVDPYYQKLKTEKEIKSALSVSLVPESAQ